MTGPVQDLRRVLRAWPLEEIKFCIRGLELAAQNNATPTRDEQIVLRECRAELRRRKAA